LGTEVQLGSGYADILAIESSGRPTIIEVKLGRNREARREIVAQVLSYAAPLHGFDVTSLEQVVLRSHLAKKGYETILAAVQDHDQDGVVDAATFIASVQEYLDRGDFRLVLVLDEVSDELERTVAYLQTTTSAAFTIDLIAVRLYETNGVQIAVPQQISPDPSTTLVSAPPNRAPVARPTGLKTEGTQVFRDSIAEITGADRAQFDTLLTWAEEVATLPHVKLSSRLGPKLGMACVSLVPRILPHESGLVTIWNDNQKPYITVWRSKFEALAPQSIASVEHATGTPIGRGTQVSPVTPAILHALTAAYEEAAGD
jgi:hypothetical protein